MRHLPLNGLSHILLSYWSWTVLLYVLVCGRVRVWVAVGLSVRVGVSGCGCVGHGAWDGCERECVFAPCLICVLQAN